jgi:hypothetical protein
LGIDEKIVLTVVAGAAASELAGVELCCPKGRPSMLRGDVRRDQGALAIAIAVFGL